jgi:hypothetical protein
LEALKARNKYVSFEKSFVNMKGPTTFRAVSAKKIFNWFHLGRWPELLHFAPLALGAEFSHALGSGWVCSRTRSVGKKADPPALFSYFIDDPIASQ